jgi:hypothetical protein
MDNRVLFTSLELLIPHLTILEAFNGLTKNTQEISTESSVTHQSPFKSDGIFKRKYHENVKRS